ncbi:MAG: O-antigen ligase family protein [Bacillus sp. (in: firmicutes)]
MNKHHRTSTYILILLNLFLVPILYFKTYIGPIPLSVEVISIPLLVLAVIWDYYRGNITFNSVNIWPFVITFGLFALVSAISLLDAVSLKSGVMELARFLSYVAVFMIAVKVKFTKEQYFNFGKVFAAATFLVAVYGFIQYIFNIDLNTAGLYALEDAKGRVYSTMVNPNYYSAFLNYVSPWLLLMAVVYFKDKKMQIATFTFYGLVVMNLILTYTRAAWVTMICALLLLIMLIPAQFIKNFIKPQILISCVILISSILFMPDVQSRTSSAIIAVQSLVFPASTETASEDQVPQNETDTKNLQQMESTNKAVFSRMTLWKTGLYMFRDNPVLGVGLGNYNVRYKDVTAKYPELDFGHETYSVHNSYIKVAAETGLLGLLATAAFYLVFFITLLRLYLKQNNTIGKIVAVSIIIGSITFMVQNLSNNLIFIPQLNIIFWLVGGLSIAFLTQNQKRMQVA